MIGKRVVRETTKTIAIDDVSVDSYVILAFSTLDTVCDGIWFLVEESDSYYWRNPSGNSLVRYQSTLEDAITEVIDEGYNVLALEKANAHNIYDQLQS